MACPPPFDAVSLSPRVVCAYNCGYGFKALPRKGNAIAKGGRADVIASASDPRIPGVHRVTQAF